LIALAAASLTLVLNAAGLWLVCRRDLHDAAGLAVGTVSTAMSGLLRRPSPPPTAAVPGESA